MDAWEAIRVFAFGSDPGLRTWRYDAAMSEECSRDESPDGHVEVVLGPLMRLALAAAVGMVLGRTYSHPSLYLLLAAGPLIASGVFAWYRSLRASWWCALAAVVLLGAGWHTVATHRLADDDIARFVTAEPQLARVRGTVSSPPRLSDPNRGTFGAFGYAVPGTLAVLSVDSLQEGDRWQAGTGDLLLKIDEADVALRAGQRIEAMGWLAAFEGPRNPGEVDYAASMAARGVRGRITLRMRGNWRLVSDTGGASSLAELRAWLSDAANRSLSLGLEDEPRRLSLLRALLLGRWEGEIQEESEAYRRVGVAHLLSISGAHLAILLGLVWGIARGVTDRPPRAAAFVLIVLCLYLLAVPLRVPIVRAGIMAGVWFGGLASARRLPGLELLGVAAVLALAWRPDDLFSPGFQLSFVVVGSLMLFAEPMAEALWPSWLGPWNEADRAGPAVGDPLAVPRGSWGIEAARWAVRYAAASGVAALTATPLVAYHFGLVSPYAVVLSLLILPVFTLVLSLGYLKVLIGMIVPSLSLVLSGPLGWLAATTDLLVDTADAWPGSSWALSRELSVAWVAAAMVVAGLLLAGRFARRRAVGAACCAIIIGWAVVVQQPAAWAWGLGDDEQTLAVNMFSVGDGSCFVIRSSQGGERHTLMFDCGSSTYLDVGEASIAPALKELGIDRLDVLVVSHADLDHFSGVIDVADAVAVGRVLVPPHVVEEAGDHPEGAAAHLLGSLAERGVPVEVMGAGASWSAAGARYDVLWPAEGFRARRANDLSLVLRVESPAGRVLLTGDVQDPALRELLRRPREELQAEVTDLPHHGSFGKESVRWLDTVAPRVVLQSCGPRRLRHDKWAATFARPNAPTRLISDELGAVEVTLSGGGAIEWRAFRGGSGAVAEAMR